MNSTYPSLGLVGGVLQYYADKEKGEKEAKETPFHAMRVSTDTAYVPLFKAYLPIKYCPVTIKN
jgi:hypothetical protein